MSFIDLEFMGIQSPDIMADSVDTKQMLLTLNSKLGWFNSLYSSSFKLDWLNSLIFARVTKAWQQDVVSNDIQCEVPIEPLLVYIYKYQYY